MNLSPNPNAIPNPNPNAIPNPNPNPKLNLNPEPNPNPNPKPNPIPSYYSSAGGDDDDDNVSEKVNPVFLTAALICFGWLLLALSLGLCFAARAEKKKLPSFRQYSDIKSCISFFEDLHNRKGVFATRHTDEFKVRDASAPDELEVGGDVISFYSTDDEMNEQYHHHIHFQTTLW